jgi:TonB-linked SusC/RagA family outer membrane protein
MQKTANGSQFFMAASVDRPPCNFNRGSRRKRYRLPAQMMRIMRLVTFILFASFLGAHASGVSQSVTISGKEISLTDVFSAIKKQTGYVVFAKKDYLLNAPKVSLSVYDMPLKDLLETVLKDMPLDFEIMENTKTIILSRRAASPARHTKYPAVTPKLTAPPIRGKVLDEEGQPLAGATIAIKNSSGSGVTDAEGMFTLNVTVDDVLVITYVGFQTKEIKVTASHISSGQISIVLPKVSSQLNDIVVVGYGSLSRKNITGSVSTVTTQGIENQPVASLDQAIAGQAAGVRVSQVTGTPGGGATIRIRGTGSISAGNEPLYVIDGFPVEGGFNRDLNPLATINAADIESIQVLKDASSAAIYGSRGSNGVVLITTKKGKAGKPTIQFDTYYGIQEVAHKIDMLNAREYALFNTEARNNAWKDLGGNASDPNNVRPDRLKIPPMFADPSSLGEGTDWQDEVFQRAPVQSYQLSVSSGNEKTTYMLSGGYFKQEGIVINTGFERYSLRFNLDSKLSDKIKIGLNIAPSYSKNDVLPVEDQVFGGGILGSALSMPPTVPVYNPDGSYTSLMTTSPFNLGIIDNPVAIANKIKGSTSAYRTLANVFAEWEVIKDLKLRSSLGGDLYENRVSSYWPSDLGRAGVAAPVTPEAAASTGRSFVWLNENTLTYDKVFNKHRLNALAGYTSQRALSEDAYLNAINFPNDLVQTLNAGQISSGGTFRSEWALRSYLARVNYSFDTRYVLTATIRRDGSSRFGQNSKWGTFPSASVGWNISEEKFMENVGFVTDLKLRASYGYAGNNSIGNYNSIGLLSSNRYVFGGGVGSLVNGLHPSSISNQELGWEVMKQTDIGIDAGFFGNRLSIIVDYFEKITSDLLLNVPVPASTGFSSALQNIGKVSNKGWEFTLSSKNLVRDFKWSTDLNVSFYKNKVLALGPKGDPIISTSRSFSPQTHITKIGLPMASFYGYEVIGIYRDQNDIAKSPVVPGGTGSRPGDLKFRDVNGDGVITPLDVTILGDNNPDYNFGITNNFAYKNFTLNILIEGVQGLQVLNGGRRNLGLVNGSYSRSDVLGRWQSPENPGDGKTPRANVAATGGNVSFVSSLLVEDASFIRMRNINLRYAIPKKVFRSAPVKTLSVFASVQNAFTITKYLGYNPEQNLNGASPLTPGIDFNGYPLARVYTLGLSVAFQ